VLATETRDVGTPDERKCGNNGSDIVHLFKIPPTEDAGVQHNEQTCCQTCIMTVREEYSNSYYGLVTPCNLVGRNQHLREKKLILA
jgi:hypothetical protein